MKKVGILTYHHAINYGATLQGYALWQSVKKQGFEVDFIDYRPLKAVKTYLVNRYLPTNLSKSWKIERFLRSQTSLGNGTTYTRSGLQQKQLPYDLVICGSDEIWNIKSFRGFDASYFLDFVPDDVQRVSYAASFGSTRSLGDYQSQIGQLLKRFDRISVRDSNSLDLVQRECQLTATQVLDPTFLADYNHITSPIQTKQAYLLIYCDRLTPAEEQFVHSLATLKHLKIISVGFYNKVAHANRVDISTQEWLGYYSQASYVVTNFYHGTIFSILFKKPFSVLSRGNKSVKVSDLLSQLNLEDRLLSATTDQDASLQQELDVDYAPIYKQLSEKVAASRNFLREALHAQH